MDKEDLLQQNELVNFPYQVFRFAYKDPSPDSVITSQLTTLDDGTGLIGVIQIDERWHHSREAASSLWQSVVREFNRSTNASPLTRFESALKKTNVLLSQVQEKISQPIHCAVIAVSDNEVHFSSVGEGKVLLVRSGRLNDVTEQADGNRDQQFSAVTSGDLDESDILFCLTPSFANQLTATERDSWGDTPLNDISANIAHRVEQGQIKDLWGIAIQYSPNASNVITKYWEEANGSLPLSIPKLSLTQAKLPKINFNFSKVSQLAVTLYSGISTLLSWLARQVVVLASQLKRGGLKPTHAIIATFIILAIGGIVIARNRVSNPTAGDDPVVTVLAKLKSATSDQLTAVAGESITTQSFNELSLEEQQELRLLLENSAIQLTPTTSVSELPKKIIALDGFGEFLMAIDEQGQLWSYENDSLVQVDQRTLVSQPLSIVVFSKETALITDQTGNIWLYEQANPQLRSLPLPGAIASGKKLIQKFNNNLYVLSLEKGEIYRFTNFSKELNNQTLYSNTSNLGIGEVQDWVINGDILTINSNAFAQAFRRNQKQSLAVTSPFTASNYTVSSDSDASAVAITAGRYVSIYSPAGELKKHNLLVSSDVITDSYMPTNNLLYLAIGREIHRLSF